MNNVKYKILIIGAGWYGCHLAKQFNKRGHNIEIWEKTGSIFGKASGFNQNRLHAGFHYPRCSKTRMQSKKGFRLFKKEYPFLCEKLEQNLYAIPMKNSLLDYKTYCDIMTITGLNFEEIIDVSSVDLADVEGIISCQEEYISPKKAKKYFEQEIGHLVKFNKFVTPGEMEDLTIQYDYIIDCTWGTSGLLQDRNMYYELCLYHTYSSETFGKNALTVMDGDFFSIYPHSENTFTVTHVDKIKVGEFKTVHKAEEEAARIKENSDYLQLNREMVENEITKIFPNFKNIFEYIEPVFSMKTKLRSRNDSRFVRVVKRANVFIVLSGKIDTIFDADTMIQNYMLEDSHV